METSFANGGQISAGHAEPWAQPAVLPKILRWLGREDAPLLFRPRADWAQWEWGLRFLLECLPGRFERNCRALAGLARYSRECLRALRERTGIQYDQLARGILHFATSAARLRRAWRATPRRCARSACEREVKSAAECLALEPALQHSEDPVVGGVFDAAGRIGRRAPLHRASSRALAAARGVRFRYRRCGRGARERRRRGCRRSRGARRQR